jgi:hypothetical protein
MPATQFISHQLVHYAYATTPYQAAYADPITMRSGEPLLFEGKEDNWQGWTWLWCTNQSGKSGWVPQNYVLQLESGYLARCDYNAIELSVQTGEILEISQAESGWLWCTNQSGQSGWVPIMHLVILPALLMDDF